jgi:hypothetical protein
VNLIKAQQAIDQAMANFTEAQKAAVKELSAVPGATFTVPTPGTEARLNGLAAADISALVRDREPGQELSKRELCEGAGGNPKSGRDMAKVAKVLPDVPEIEYRKGTRSLYVRRLTDNTAA